MTTIWAVDYNIFEKLKSQWAPSLEFQLRNTKRFEIPITNVGAFDLYFVKLAHQT